jgi:hypothetical protein
VLGLVIVIFAIIFYVAETSGIDDTRYTFITG